MKCYACEKPWLVELRYARPGWVCHLCVGQMQRDPIGPQYAPPPQDEPLEGDDELPQLDLNVDWNKPFLGTYASSTWQGAWADKSADDILAEMRKVLGEVNATKPPVFRFDPGFLEARKFRTKLDDRIDEWRREWLAKWNTLMFRAYDGSTPPAGAPVYVDEQGRPFYRHPLDGGPVYGQWEVE
jgi:hypothetical protein